VRSLTFVSVAPLNRVADLDCVRHVHRLKVTSFAEHSPLLYDITAVKGWEKVNTGLLKMYRAEVRAQATPPAARLLRFLHCHVDRTVDLIADDCPAVERTL
jgi:hypothetical protein